MSAPPIPLPAPSPAPGSIVLAAVSVLAWMLVMAVSPVAADPTKGRWQWPMDPPHRVLHGFEQPEHRYTAGHRGLDIAAPGREGTPIRAVEAGTVRFAGDVAGRGVISVLHADGLLSTYEPVTAQVAAGEPVAAGAVLGQLAQVRVGASHCPEGPCLHLGARRGEDYLDPMLLLGARGPSVLLPLGGGTGGGGTGGGGTGGGGTGGGGDGGAGVSPSGSRSEPVRATGGSRVPGSLPGASAPLHGYRWVLAD